MERQDIGTIAAVNARNICEELFLIYGCSSISARNDLAEQAANRIQAIGGDFFQDDLPQGDLYALGRILHDWSEEKIERLLQKIYSALPEEGAVMIGERF